jgi:predicted SAM-dependent methyltransferase
LLRLQGELFQLLNHAARYFPILRELREHLQPGGKLVEIGSGPVGIGEFYSHPFVGCDVSFSEPPKKPMEPVVCSADQLPFLDQSFDAVIASDVMEHIVPDKRRQVVTEIFRITRRIAIVGFPCGPKAREMDEKLYQHYQNRNRTPPLWLEEHMLNPFPEESLFAKIPDGWRIKVISNENLRFHYWMMRAETCKFWDYSFRTTLRVAPTLVRSLLDRFNGDPSYRKIFVFTREP